MIPENVAFGVFGILAALLIHNEVVRALGRSGSRKARRVRNTAIAGLVVLYGLILITRFLDLLR